MPGATSLQQILALQLKPWDGLTFPLRLLELYCFERLCRVPRTYVTYDDDGGPLSAWIQKTNRNEQFFIVSSILNPTTPPHSVPSDHGILNKIANCETPCLHVWRSRETPPTTQPQRNPLHTRPDSRTDHMRK